MKQAWFEEFKLALIEEDVEQIERLSSKLSFDENKLEELKALIQESINLVQLKKNELASEMQKLQRAREYIENGLLNIAKSSTQA